MDPQFLPPSSFAKQNIDRRVFSNFGDALYNASFLNKDALIQISDLLNLDITSQNFHRQHYINEMVDKIQQRYAGVVSFLRRTFPSRTNLTYTILLILVLGIVAELSIYDRTKVHSWDLFSAWYIFISLAVSISSTSMVFSLIRNYIVSTSQANLLGLVNLIERSTEEELNNLNHCIYVPLWRKMNPSHPCKFSLKTWILSGLRGGWTIDQNNIDSLKHSPFQEGLLEIMRKSKLQRLRRN